MVNPGAGDHCDVFHLDPAKVAALKKKLLSEASVGALAETFKLLGDTTRVRILDALSRSELCVCDIAGLLGLSESAVSHQLRLLRGVRLVRPRRAGRMVFYTLDDQHIVGLFEQGLEHVEERKARADVRVHAGSAAARVRVRA
jgi:DNA-binding transcriptional ArsR family regulator